MKTRNIIATLIFALSSSGAYAEPVHVAQGESSGKGFAIRRGNDCFVLTAQHVLGEPGTPIRVSDRSSAESPGHSIFADSNADFALIQLDGKVFLACTDTWEAPAWLAGKRFSASDEFTVVKHDKTGSETIYRYSYAGGTKQELVLAPKDRSRAVKTDSGSPVFFGDRFVGLLVEVSTASDRVSVLRADVIDTRLAQVLRGQGVAERVIAFRSVNHRARPVADWTVYARDELANAGVGSIVTGDAPEVSCQVSANILDVTRTREANSQYEQLESSYKANCSRQRGGFAKLMCESNKKSLQTMPRFVSVWLVEVDVSIERSGQGGATKLGSHRFTTDPGIAVDVAQRSIVGKSVAATVKAMVGEGACD